MFNKINQFSNWFGSIITFIKFSLNNKINIIEIIEKRKNKQLEYKHLNYYLEY